MSEALHLVLRRSPPPARPRRIHDMRCRCHVCDPWKAHKVEHANRLALQAIVGLVLGLALAWAIDIAVAGPGILSIFGVVQ